VLHQTRPELEVAVARKTITVDGDTLKGRIAQLVAGGFFDSNRSGGEARSELKRTWHDVNPGSLWRTLGELIADGFLVLEGKSYRVAAGAKVRVVEA
jgi:hypothetical protein